MFTGIVETEGTIESLKSTDNGTILTLTNCTSILSDAHEGDSISINGTCLTITAFTSAQFTVGVSPETLRRTNLGDLHTNSRVNLERAVSSSTRMGGHFVQGHVDTVASILSVAPDGEALTFRLQPHDPAVLNYVVEKGYVTLDGASLTITNVDDDNEWFEVMLIAYTQERVVMGRKEKGDLVNVEVDMVGKYIEKSVRSFLQGGHGSEGLQNMLERIVKKELNKAN